MVVELLLPSLLICNPFVILEVLAVAVFKQTLQKANGLAQKLVSNWIVCLQVHLVGHFVLDEHL